jgi:hypothetical protein
LSCFANELLRANARKRTVQCRPSESIIAFIRQVIFLSSVWRYTWRKPVFLWRPGVSRTASRQNSEHEFRKLPVPCKGVPHLKAFRSFLFPFNTP